MDRKTIRTDRDIDLDKIKQTLEERRAVLLTRVAVKRDSEESRSINPDRADMAQDYFLKERNSALRERLEGTLEQIEDALKRLRGGTYGKCTRCGEEIASARLQAIPHADLCIACQKQQEAHGKII